MVDFFSKYKWFWIVLSIVSIIIISIIYAVLKPTIVLPIYAPDGAAKIDLQLMDSTVHEVRKHHRIPDFSLVNQNGKEVTQTDYENTIYVADFFFTTCLTICPVMTDHMKQIQESIKNDPSIKLLSHTVLPAVDTVAQLKRYAMEKGVNDQQWNLVTGTKKQLYDLARKAYLVAKLNPSGGDYDMIHTENFVLIDKQKRIRGFYDGTDGLEIERLLGDIVILKQE